MAMRSQDLSQQLQALAPIHREIKGICEALGIDVNALETVAERHMLRRPWHESSAPENCLKEAREIQVHGQSAEEDLHDELENFVTYCPGLLGAVAAVNNKTWEDPAKVVFLARCPLNHYSMVDSGRFPMSDSGRGSASDIHDEKKLVRGYSDHRHNYVNV
jgi:hypothetical protein